MTNYLINNIYSLGGSLKYNLLTMEGKMKITLINANLVQVPAVAPIALDVLSSSLRAEGFEVELLDLCPVADAFEQAIEKYFSNPAPDFVGITFRNAWDLYFNSVGAIPGNGSFIPSHARVAAEILKYFPQNKIVAGGIGFSSMPHYMLDKTGLRFGVVGAGEKIIGEIFRSLQQGVVPRYLKGFVEKGFSYEAATDSNVPIVVSRKFSDNNWYYENGGLIGLRTNNGCAMNCVYCIEPKCKGGIFLRDPQLIVQEIDQLVDQGIRDIHFTDSECNLPFQHSKNVLETIAHRAYPSDLKFWSYAQILPFDEEYAALAEKAGVAGILFSVDHIDPKILRLLGKSYGVSDIENTTRLCDDHGIKVFHELIIRIPGDNLEKVKMSIDYMRKLDPYVTGITIGVGIMSGCALSENEDIVRISKLSYEERVKEGLFCRGLVFKDPTYYVTPALKFPDIIGQVRDYVGDDIYRIMAPTLNSTEKSDDQLVNNPNRIIKGWHGAAWAYYRDLFKD